MYMQIQTKKNVILYTQTKSKFSGVKCSMFKSYCATMFFYEV